MEINGNEIDIVADAEFIKERLTTLKDEYKRAMLDNIAHDIVEHCREVIRCYSTAMENKTRPTPKKCYTDLRKELLWLTKAQKVFQLVRMDWQKGLKS